jgi:hypothetical protein
VSLEWQADLLSALRPGFKKHFIFSAQPVYEPVAENETLSLQRRLIELLLRLLELLRLRLSTGL